MMLMWIIVLSGLENKSTPLFISVLYFLSLFVTELVQAKIYKCKDENGVTKYTSIQCGKNDLMFQKYIRTRPENKKTRKFQKQERRI